MESSFVRSQSPDTAPRSALRRLHRPLLALITCIPLLVLVLSIVHAVAPRPDGMLALTEIFAPYLYLGLLALLPFAWSQHGRGLRWALLACVVVCCARFGPGAISLPRSATPGATELSVLSWNTYVDNTESAVPPTIAAAPAGIVAIQELTKTQRDALVADPAIAARYPYQLLRPGGASGMGLLSRYPIVESGEMLNPDVPLPHYLLWARLDVEGRQVVVVSAHPRPGNIGFLSGTPVPVAFEPAIRDAEIRYIRSVIAPFLERGEPLLLVGDFNTTEREPIYRELMAGLQDAQREVGIGPGHTWRPKQLLALPLGLIRIDYQLASPQLRPLRLSADCTPRGSDHCALQGVWELLP